MSTSTDTDIRELKELINGKFEQLDKKLDVNIASTGERLKAIESNVKTLEDGLATNIKDLKDDLASNVKKLEDSLATNAKDLKDNIKELKNDIIDDIKDVKEEIKAQNSRFWTLVAFLGTAGLGGLGTAIGVIIKVFLFPSSNP